MLAVFSDRLGLDAIRDGWSPELLFDLRKNRIWPTAYVASLIRKRAEESICHFKELESKLAGSEQLSPTDNDFRQRRVNALEKCRHVSQTALQAAE